jgi:hypothetical protein
MAKEIQGWLRPRPPRVAFLVQENEHANLMLDGIFADCHSRWGGRFSLLVPCVDNSIPSQYWPWLESYDPDIVVTHVTLAHPLVLEIHERLNPSDIIDKTNRSSDDPPRRLHDYKPHYDFGSPLESLSTIFSLARRQPHFERGPALRLLDYQDTKPRSRFFLDNFGSLRDSRSTSIYPKDAESVMGLSPVVSPEMLADRRYGSSFKGVTTIPDEMTAFCEFADGHLIGIAQLSALLAPKLELRNHRWSDAFNLVIGETYADRLLFWNARHLIPSWLDGELSCFRVTMDQLRDSTFRNVLVKMLNRRNRVNSGSGGQSLLTISSLSCIQGELEEARTLLAEEKLWSVLTIQKVATLGELIPNGEALAEAKMSSRFTDSMQRTAAWESFVWTPPKARPPHATPFHLVDLPPKHTFAKGCFAVDYDFEIDQPNALSRSSTLPRWEIPRRWRMAGAFRVERGQAQYGRIMPRPRRSRNGHLALLVDSELYVDSINVPNVEDAVRYALLQDGRRYGRYDLGYPENKVELIRPSNEARYLSGVLGLTNGLNGAVTFLLHPFLTDLFARLGGSTKIAVKAVEPTVNRLRKTSQSKSTYNTLDPQDCSALAELVVKAARSLKSSDTHVEYEVLKSSWAQYLKEFWARPGMAKHVGPGEAADYEKSEQESLEECLIELRKRKILFQGHLWLCPECHYRNWVDMSQLASQLKCGVCGKIKDTEVSVQWRFKPNPFIIDALREHSILSLIWALAKIRESAERTFTFVGPCWYYYQPSDSPQDQISPDAESDLIVLLDGQVYLCEIKATWRQLRSTDLPTIVSLSKKLRPDNVLLAVMEASPGPTKSLEATRTELQAESIGFKVITLGREIELYDGPYLI